MKKIYLLILCAINLLVFCTISKRIFASVDIQNVKKTMIAEVCSIKPKDLEYEGYQIVSSNINFNRSVIIKSYIGMKKQIIVALK